MVIDFKSGPYAGRTFPVNTTEPIVFGRAGNAPLPDTRASRQHARLSRHLGRWMLEDLNSRNGTFLNQTRVSGPVTVQEGDTIVIGRSTLVLRDLDVASDDVETPHVQRGHGSESFAHAESDDAFAGTATATSAATAPHLTSPSVDADAGSESAYDPFDLPAANPWDDDALAADWPELANGDPSIEAPPEGSADAIGEVELLQAEAEPSVGGDEAEQAAGAVDSELDESPALEATVEPPVADEPSPEVLAANLDEPPEPAIEAEEAIAAAAIEPEFTEQQSLSTNTTPTETSFSNPSVISQNDKEPDVLSLNLEALTPDEPQAAPRTMTQPVDVESGLPQLILEPELEPGASPAEVGQERGVEPGAGSQGNAELRSEEHSAAEGGADAAAVAESDADDSTPAIEVESPAVSEKTSEPAAIEGSISTPLFSEWDVHEGEIVTSSSEVTDFSSQPNMTMAFVDDAGVIQPQVYSAPPPENNRISSTPELSADEVAEAHHAAATDRPPVDAPAPAASAPAPSFIELKRVPPPEPAAALATRPADALGGYAWPPQAMIVPGRRIWPYLLLASILIIVVVNVALQLLAQKQLRTEVATLRGVLEQNEQATAEVLINEIRREIREAPRDASAQSLNDLNKVLAEQTAASERAARELASKLERDQARLDAQEKQRTSQAAQDVSRVLAELDTLKQSISKLSESTALATAQQASAETSRASAAHPGEPESAAAELQAPSVTEAQDAQRQPAPALPSQGGNSADREVDASDAAVQARSKIAALPQTPPASVYLIDASEALKNTVPETLAEVRRLMRQGRARDTSIVLMLYGDRLVQVNDPAIATAANADVAQDHDVVDLGQMDLNGALKHAVELRPRTLHLLSDTLGKSETTRQALNALNGAGVHINVVQFYSRKSQDTLKAIAREHNGFYTYISASQ